MSNEEVINIKDVKGVELDTTKLAENERLWQGQIADIEEKKTGKGTPYWIFKAHEDENGMQFAFVTFSSTNKAIILDSLTNMRATKIVYQLPAKFGSFNIVCAELPDGTFSAKEARDSWKKGNKANNRAAVIQAAVALANAQKAIANAEIVIAYAEELLKWVEKEDKS